MWWIVAILAILVVGWMMFARNDTATTETPRSSLIEQPRPGAPSASLAVAGSPVEIARRA